MDPELELRRVEQTTRQLIYYFFTKKNILNVDIFYIYLGTDTDIEIIIIL